MTHDRHLYIISGPNGAGKTTASYTVLPRILQCREFVNADEIAHGLSPFNPGSVAIEAGRLMLRRIDELLQQGESFAIETTLATTFLLTSSGAATMKASGTFSTSMPTSWIHGSWQTTVPRPELLLQLAEKTKSVK